MIANKADFGGGEGEWQCLIGKNMAATLTYDIHKLSFFDLPEFGYTVLVFKSGWNDWLCNVLSIDKIIIIVKNNNSIY